MQTIARTPIQFGNYIREKRRKLDLTQEELGEKVGVRQATVSEIEETGKARLDTVLRLLAVLELELVVRERTKGSADDIEANF